MGVSAEMCRGSANSQSLPLAKKEKVAKILEMMRDHLPFSSLWKGDTHVSWGYL